MSKIVRKCDRFCFVGSGAIVAFLVMVKTIFDTERDHYQLVYVGWHGSDRVYGVVLPVDIQDGKIWVQQDGTEIGIAQKLIDLGVPSSDIAIGCDPPRMRQYTEFATG
jgi:hypothetical protein